MKFTDLLIMSLGSLWKRKVRTILTVLGVVIGTVSVVIMISLGIGMKKTMLEQMESYGSLKLIEVTEGYDNDGGDDPTKGKLSEDVVAMFENLDHVESVVPLLECSGYLIAGRYQCYANIYGVSYEGMKKLDIKLASGELPKDETELKPIYGNNVIAQFYDKKSDFYPYYDTGELADVDLANDTIFLVLNTSAYDMAGSKDENGNIIKKPKKRIVECAGLMEGSVEDWSTYSYYVVVNIEALKTALKKEYKNSTIPGQPTTKKGKPYKEFFYTTVNVYADSMENVAELQKQIKDMGYETYASAEWIDSEMKTLNTIQLVLGGIGAVSLIVAAIGIINTMMMSIYERTKEIGVMKVIGCRLRDIQLLFLMEAAFIGFIGGAVGTGISYALSPVINKALSGGEDMMFASVIPPWLAVLAVVFSTIIGMIAGFLPSLRAMRLSPLEAMRT